MISHTRDYSFKKSSVKYPKQIRLCTAGEPCPGSRTPLVPSKTLIIFPFHTIFSPRTGNKWIQYSLVNTHELVVFTADPAAASNATCSRV